MTERVLFVDDDTRVLQALERQLHKQFQIQTALGPELGLQAIASAGPFAVVVSDLRMPGMNGIEFLTRVRQAAPDAVRVMLTGEADLSATIAAVNDGQIFQFLTKPCPSDMLARAVKAALEQHRLITAERELLENTLRGAIGVLSEILGLVNPQAFSRTQRLRRYVQHMAQKLNLSEAWQYEVAAMLSQIGCVTVPPSILEKSYRMQPLTPAEEEILTSQSRVGSKLLVKIPRLENVGQMVAQQQSPWTPQPGAPDPVKTGAHLLKVASDFDEQVMRGNSLESVLTKMRGSPQYNPAFVAALQELQLEEAQSEVRWVNLAQLRPQMIISAGVYSKTGLVLLAKGQEVTDSAIARLNSFASLFGIIEPISVMVPQGERTEKSIPPNAAVGTISIPALR